MEDNLIQLLFFLSTIPIICKTNIFAIKCCGPDEQLSANLMSCQKINTDTNFTKISHRKSIKTDSQLFNNSITSSPNNESNFDISWLPKQLRNHLHESDVLVFGKQNNCSRKRTVRLQTPRDDNRLNWLPNGSLVLTSFTVLGNTENRLFEPQDFCIDSFTSDNETQHHAVLLCPCSRMQCLKKCCPIGEALVCDKYECSCHPYISEWIPFFHDSPEPNEDFSFEIVSNQNLTCDENYQDLVYIFDSYPLYLLHRFWTDMLRGGENNICGDMVVGLYDSPRQGMIKCSPEIPFLNVYVFINWLHVPEAVLLASTLIIACVVPRKRLSSYSYVHDLSLVFHAASLFARCLLWSVYLEAKWSCSVIPILIYFFSLAASFWLNVVCLNMACGFWKPLGVQHSRWGRARQMFLLYSLYAWGATAAMTSFTAAMWYSRVVPAGMLRPTLHETRTCFREEEGDGKLATFAYYYAVIGGLLCVNALLFCSTAIRVRQLRLNTAILQNNNSGSDASFRNKRSVMIYVKLLLLMGVLEMAIEAVAWLSNSNEYYFALAVTCLDLLRAAAIFFLCCCKRKTMKALRERLCACVEPHLPRWCCPWRTKQEADLQFEDRSSKATSTTSVITEVNMSDSDGTCSVQRVTGT